MVGMGKILIFLGLLLVGAGIVLVVFEKIPGFGRLPGDILIKRENFMFYFPLMTCLVISFVISIVLWLLNKK
jgi:ABC-type dipeptide/oligopeptide/nickel transport system permease component